MARFGSDQNEFDVSDVEIDALDDVLDISAEILVEYGEDPGITRIERMARFLSLHLGSEPYGPAESTGGIAQFNVGPVTVWRVGNALGIGPSGPTTETIHRISATEARQIAVMLLRAAELADE